MSLQTRLSDLITAVGADIKADRARLTLLEGATAPPRCLLYKTAAQTIAASTFVPIVWEGEDEDLSGMHAANATTVVVPTAGIYFASAFIGFSVGNVSGRFLTMIYVNGAESRGGFRHEITMAAIGTAAWHTGLPTGLFKLNAGDTLSVVVYQTSGGTLSVSSNSDNAKFSVFKVDMKGVKGDQGDVGPAGPTGPSATAPQIDWQSLPILTGTASWEADVAGTVAPAWMLGPDGMVHVRGRVRAKAGGSGIDLTDMSPIFAPFTDPAANRVCIPAVNQTSGAMGYWEILSTGLVWHGTKTTGDNIGLDGMSWPSAINGPLGAVVTPTLASGWTSDATNPLKVWSTGTQMRITGAVQGSLVGPSGNTLIFTVPGLTSVARSMVALAPVVTVSGANHPSSDVLGASDFVVGTDGTVRVTPQFAGTNVVKITFTGAYSK